MTGMTLDNLRTTLAASLNDAANGVAVLPDYPDTPPATPKTPSAVLGLKSVNLKPLCFGEGLGGEQRIRRAELVFSLDIRAATAGDCLNALNNLSVAALTVGCEPFTSPELAAGGAVPEKSGGVFRLVAEIKTSAVIEVRPETAAEIIKLDLAAKVTI